MAWRGVWIALASCLFLLAMTSDAHAEPMTVIVRVAQPADDAMLNRILGQTSDLPLRIVRATALAPAEPGARAVVSFDISADEEITLFVLVPEAKRQLVAHIDRDAGSPSARLESASLIVRDALQSVLEGRPIGAPIEEPPPPLRAEPPPPVVRAKPRPPPPPKPSRAAWLPISAVGARVVFAHATPSYATTSRLGLSHERLEVGVSMTLGATDVEQDALASLLTRRHAFGAFGGWRFALNDQLDATADLNAGVILFVRDTRPNVAELLPAPAATNAHPFVGPEARISWRPGPAWLRISFSGGLDAVFAAPTFLYEGSPRQLAIWPIQPYFTALVEGRWQPDGGIVTSR